MLILIRCNYTVHSFLPIFCVSIIVSWPLATNKACPTTYLTSIRKMFLLLTKGEEKFRCTHEQTNIGTPKVPYVEHLISV